MILWPLKEDEILQMTCLLVIQKTTEMKKAFRQQKSRDRKGLELYEEVMLLHSHCYLGTTIVIERS